MTSTAAPVTLRSPGEMVSAIPFLLGFVPTESLVTIAVRDGQVALTARADIKDLLQPECTRSIVEAVRRTGASTVYLIAYGDSRFDTAPALARMVELLTDAGMEVQDQISVMHGWWYHERCSTRECCSPQGMPVTDHNIAPSTLALSTLSRGYRADRDEVVAECRPDRPLLTAAIRSEIDHPGEDADGYLETVADDLCAILGWGGGAPPTPVQLARAAIGCSSALMRDVWYAVVAPGIMGELSPQLGGLHARVVSAGQAAGDLGSDGILLDPAARDRVVDRVLTWVRNLPDDRPEVTVWALVVAAAAHLCAGDGARSRLLTERAWALQTDPPGMLETLTTCLHNGVRPPGAGRLSRDSADDDEADC